MSISRWKRVSDSDGIIGTEECTSYNTGHTLLIPHALVQARERGGVGVREKKSSFHSLFFNFPQQFHKVKWLNKQLSKLWPFVADAAEAVIKESVEPLLEEYHPVWISSLKFSKLSLGTEGIRVQSLKEGRITMDIDVRWGGDPSIILAVESAHVASIRIQNLEAASLIRPRATLPFEEPTNMN